MVSCALWAVVADVQAYQTHSGYVNVEIDLDRGVSDCLVNSESYLRDLGCARRVYDICTERGPDGDTTSGLAICGGVASNVIDRQMNDVWARINNTASKSEFAEILDAQRDWLKYRERESQAAATRHAGGSLGAVSGWLRRDDLSTERLARLREISRNY